MSEVQQVAVGEVTSGWAELSKKVVEAAKEICGGEDEESGESVDDWEG